MNRSFTRDGWRWLVRQLEAGFDLIYPSRCAGCGVEGAVWCVTCQRQIRRIGTRVCEWCGHPLRRQTHCDICEAVELPMRVRSYAHYEGPVARALLMLKYRPSRNLAIVMAGWLAELIQSSGWRNSTIVPVPLGAERLRQRGYNQAALLGDALAKWLDSPIEVDLLERHRETRSQVGLDARERHENVRGAFRAAREIKMGERCLLVDDLFTTGATLAACTYALQEAGSEDVYAVTVARATGRKRGSAGRESYDTPS